MKVAAALAAILVAAAGLRLPRLDTVPAAAWIDEAIEGLQAAALREGETLPATPILPFWKIKLRRMTFSSPEATPMPIW